MMAAPVHEDNFSRFYRRALAGQEESWFTRWLRRSNRPKQPGGQRPDDTSPRAPADGPAPPAVPG